MSDLSNATMEEVDAAFADFHARRLAAETEFKEQWAEELAAIKARRDELESAPGYKPPTVLADGTVNTEPGPPELAQGIGG